MEIDQDQQLKKQNLLTKRLSRFGTNGKKLTTVFSFTNHRKSTYSFILTSNREKDETNTFVLQLGRYMFKFSLPRFIKPLEVGVFQKVWGHHTDGKESDSKKRWTFVYAPKVYGVGYLPKEKVFHFFYGVQSGNSKGFPRDKFKVWIPPFMKYRISKHQIVGKNDEVFWKNTNLNDKVRQSRLAVDVIGLLCPKVRFKALDTQNREIIGSVFCEEKEWVRGVFLFGKFRYVSKRVSRRAARFHLQTLPSDPTQKPTSLIVDFSMMPDESLENAIIRFCSSHQSITSPKTSLSFIEFMK